MPPSITFDEEESDGIWKVAPAPGAARGGAADPAEDDAADDAPPRPTLGTRWAALVRGTKALVLRFKPNPPPNRNHKRSRPR